MKACLQETLSIQEKKNILFKSEPLGGRKPTQMLANMLAYFPSGMEQQSIMFQYMFLLVTLRTLLEQQEPGDITLKKRNSNFPHIKGNLEWRSCKVI
jgi:hypothetical protein